MSHVIHQHVSARGAVGTGDSSELGFKACSDFSSTFLRRVLFLSILRIPIQNVYNDSH